MTPFAIGCLGMVVLIIAIFLRMPIGMAMILVGVGGFGAISGLKGGLGLLQSVPYETFVQNSFSVVPLFVLMGNFVFKAGIGKDLYWAVSKCLGAMKGGLAMATVAACACFAAICGSSVATAVTMGVVGMPEMKKFKYSNKLATGAIAAGGTLGILIPPSTIMVIYGIITEQSIGKLFMAGFIPGILQALIYIGTIHFQVRRNPSLGPAGEHTPVGEKVRALSKVWSVLLLFVVVIGGIYAGIFTPNEAAGVGAFGAFVLGLGYAKKNVKGFLKESFLSTLSTSGMCFLILMGALIFGYFLAVSRVPFVLSEYIASLHTGPYAVILGILLVMMILGCFMDSMAIVLLTVPVFFPLIQTLHIDPIWFGILVVRVTEMGLITPPVGLNLYVIKGVADVPMGDVFHGVVPFICADFVHLAVLLAFPQIALFLPNLLM
jgi:tripartite ATP-independent transporter DctM subunit